MLEPLQKLVDDLAEHLQRSIAVDDVHFSLLVSSRHFGDEDEVRVGALVGRRPSEVAVKHVLAQGIRSLQRPARIRGNPALGLKDRICVPLRSEGVLLAYLWLIDDASITEAEIEVVVTTAERLTTMIARQRRAEEEAIADQERLARGLLTGDAAAVSRSAQEILDRGLLPGQQHYLVFLSRPRIEGQLTPNFETAGVEELLSQARRFLQAAFTGESSTARLSARVGDAVATIIATRTAPTPEQAARMGERLNKALIRRDTGLRWPSWVTVGGASTPELADLWQSYQQARRAQQAACFSERATATWHTLSPLETVFVLFAPDVPGHLAPELLEAVRTRLSDELRDTLRRFLDRAGDAAQVAQEMHLHRSTVYYRLSRAEQLLGLSLSDGTARTAVHLCLILDPTIQPSAHRPHERRPPERRPPSAP